MSGRITRSSVDDVSWVTKSQCSTMPASSTTRFSCSSPHAPRTCGLRSAVVRALVSRRTWSPVSCTARTCSRSSDAIATRSFSTSVRRFSKRSRLAFIGAMICSVALRRCSADASATLLCRSSTSFDITLNCVSSDSRSAASSAARCTAASRSASAVATCACSCAIARPDRRRWARASATSLRDRSTSVSARASLALTSDASDRAFARRPWPARPRPAAGSRARVITELARDHAAAARQPRRRAAARREAWR